MSRDDFTTSKLAPDNNTNTTEPPNNVEEAKPEGVNLADIYYLGRWWIVRWHKVIIQRQCGLEMLLGLGVEKECLNICQHAYL